ncbi:MAG: malto-oligosyltrehalose synthase [Candidatus Thermoplasmatota archaeon]|nr:malto-oligosyltrehalose synthase [Candidatus Thermoplasmatota archaeon]
MRPTLTATYRIQFNRSFPLIKIKELICYLKKMGVSHIYCSPVLESIKGSNHGYNVVNLERINPELGGEDEFIKMSKLVHENGMGWIQDIVPNHMAMSSQNVYLQDIFKNGPKSHYYNLFDVFHSTNFQSKKIDLPILGTTYERALKDKIISKNGQMIEIEGEKFSLLTNSGTTFGQNLRLEDLLKFQYFRPLYYRAALSGTNYRRFFSVNSLIAIRPEKYFSLVMGKVTELERKGLIDGYRIDHIDGLFEPGRFISKTKHKKDVFVFVEKILGKNEKIQPSWSCDGTTGYDFLFYCTYLFIDGKNKSELLRVYRKFTDESTDLQKIIQCAKYSYMNKHFISEIDYVTDIFFKFIKNRVYGQECNIHSLRNALTDLLANIPVYRTYVPNASSFETLEKAIESSRKSSKDNDAFYVLERLLHDKASTRLFKRLEQFMPAITAKSIEDNAFFRYVPLVSANEIGCDPASFSISPEEFHKFNLDRFRVSPNSINTLSTHDTKLGEDLRAKINVISEIPEEWEKYIQLWNSNNMKFKTNDFPSNNDEYYFYQILLALDPSKWDSKFEERVSNQMLKMARESGANTDWDQKNDIYEKALLCFIHKSMNNVKFRKSYNEFYNRIEPYGSLNSISQNVLKITAPGIPDTFQGSELTNNFFTDPDNRIPANFSLLSQELEYVVDQYQKGNFSAFLENLSNGRLKLLTSYVLLNLRKRSNVFLGEYVPLSIHGKLKDNLIAFSRVYKKETMIVVVPIKIASLNGDLPLSTVWKDTRLILNDHGLHKFTDIFTNEVYEVRNSVRVENIIRIFPFSVLIEGAHK